MRSTFLAAVFRFPCTPTRCALALVDFFTPETLRRHEPVELDGGREEREPAAGWVPRPGGVRTSRP
jgi:hypothetical protein